MMSTTEEQDVATPLLSPDVSESHPDVLRWLNREKIRKLLQKAHHPVIQLKLDKRAAEAVGLVYQWVTVTTNEPYKLCTTDDKRVLASSNDLDEERRVTGS